MTHKPFLKFLAVFSLLYFCAIWSIIAAPKWKDEVGIRGWCYDLKVLQATAKEEAAGNPEVADGIIGQAMEKRDCVALPLPVATFKPSGIADQFPSFGGKQVTIVRGNLVQKDDSLGREVYVVVPNELLGQFQLDEQAKIPPFSIWSYGS